MAGFAIYRRSRVDRPQYFELVERLDIGDFHISTSGTFEEAERSLFRHVPGAIKASDDNDTWLYVVPERREQSASEADWPKPATADHQLLPCLVCGAMADKTTPRRDYVARLQERIEQLSSQCARYEAFILRLEGRISNAMAILGATGGTIDG